MVIRNQGKGEKRASLEFFYTRGGEVTPIILKRPAKKTLHRARGERRTQACGGVVVFYFPDLC